MIFTRCLNHSLISLITILILATVKLTFFTSLSAFHFSIHVVLAPLLGMLFGASTLQLYFAIKLILHALAATTVYSFLSLCSLPSLCAAIYLASISQTQYTMNLQKKAFFSLLVLGCLALFVSKTYSTVACFYALFWVIPLAALWLPHQNLFVHMLVSTFTAHAVGSVLWLFFGPVLAPQAWLTLMPLVICERLALATSMWISYHAITTTLQKIKRFQLWQSRKTA